MRNAARALVKGLGMRRGMLGAAVVAVALLGLPMRGAGAAGPGLIISEWMANPAGDDGSKEYVELIATRAIDFSVSPYSIVFTNNSAATSAGWIAGGRLSYGFSITTGVVSAGDVVYVGGTEMTPTGTKLRVIDIANDAGDGFGIAYQGVLGNGGSSADGIAIFDLGIGYLTNSAVPIDAVFFGSSMGSAVVSGGAAGFQLPVNELYSGGKLQTNSFRALDAIEGMAHLATGTYDAVNGVWTTNRTFANGPATDGVSAVALLLGGGAELVWSPQSVSPESHLWSTAGGNTNWLKDGTTPAAFAAGDNAIFDDSASSGLVVVEGSVAPGTMLFDNSAVTYDVSGGTIGGGSLTKRGTGVLYLSGQHTYEGPLTIENGNMVVDQVANGGVASSLGAGTGPIILGGATTRGSLWYDSLEDASTNRGLRLEAGGGMVGVLDGELSIRGAITGDGALVKDGIGTLALANGNSYKGGTEILYGALRIDNSSGAAIVSETFFGDAAGPVTIDYATLLVSGTSSILSPGTRQFRIGRDGAEIYISNSSGNGYTIQGAVHGMGPIFKTGPGVLRFGSMTAGVASDSTFFGGLDIYEGTVALSPNEVAGRTALRSNAVYIEEGAELRSADELRIGELNGAGLLTAVGAGGAGRNVMIHALGDAMFQGTLDMGTDPRGTLCLRGAGTQTLLGSSVGSPAGIIIGQGTLALAGDAAMNANPVYILLNGGTFTLDNSEMDHADRLFDGDAGPITPQVQGAGAFRYVGSADGSSEVLGSIGLSDSGTIRVVVEQMSSSSATLLDFANLYQSDGGSVDFVAVDGVLGAAGANPRIQFLSFEPEYALAGEGQTTLVNGIIGRKGLGGGPDACGFAVVNGSDWATYDDVAGIRAYNAYTSITSAGAADNAIVTGGHAVGGMKVVNSLKIAPQSAGQAMSIASGGEFLTLALLHAGDHDYSITGAGSVFDVGATRQVNVGDGRTLTISAAIKGSADGQSPIAKWGDGLLVLAGTQTFTDALQIMGGVVRAEPGAGLPAGARLDIRGGVFEIAGPAIETTLVLGLGTGAGQANWVGGGFAARGGPRKLDVGATGVSDLGWEQPHFIGAGSALMFGSRTADGRIELIDNLSLNPAGGDEGYNLREIRVIDNPSSASDRAVLSGRLTSSVRNDLLKMGDGILDISSDNSSGFAGGVIVGEGTVVLGHDQALGNPAYVRMGLRSGGADTALFAKAGVSVGHDIYIMMGGSGIAALGLESGGGASFTGSLFLDNHADLYAPAGGTTTFAGPVNISEAVWVAKTGAGDVEITGPLSINSYSVLEVFEGTLTTGRMEAGEVWVDEDTTLVLRDEGGSRSTIEWLDIKLDTEDAWAGTVDITSNQLLLFGASMELVNSQVAQGLQDGRGIVSSLTGGITTLAVLPEGDLDVLVMRTYAGDFDGDGEVTGADYYRLDQSLLSGLANPLYMDGDADYSGALDGDDYYRVDQAYLNQQGPLTDGPGAAMRAAVSVPEPSVFAVTAIAGAGLLMRRRRALGEGFGR